MIIKWLIANNYRTLENIDVQFNGYYTAISGRNNAGKSNLIRVIRGLLSQSMRFRFSGNSIIDSTDLEGLIINITANQV